MTSSKGFFHPLTIPIAEGVETVDQARFLKDLDCNEVQGYYYFRPLPKEQVTALLVMSNYNPVK